MSAPLHVHALVGQLGLGGAEMVVAEFAAAAGSAGIRCTVAHVGHLPSGPAADRVRRAGVEVVHVPTSSLLGRDDLRRVHAHLRRVQPDVLHTHLDYADVLGGLSALHLDLPTVSTVHRAQILPGLQRRVTATLAAGVRRLAADRVITVSEADREHYLRTAFERRGRVVAIRNAVGRPSVHADPAAIRAELGLPADAFLVTMVSVMRPEKGHDVAVDAFREIRRRVPRAHLLVVGDGEQRGLVQAAADELGEGAIRLLGERMDVMRILDASDVFVQPSRAEGLPMALIEAIAAGLPVVATAVGGVPELVDDRIGVLLGPEPEAGPLAEAVIALADDDARRARLAAGARALYASRFTPDAWVARHREVYDAVLARRG
jgi:glycosyltransferase involved in cell wall biosynthesis